MPRGDFVVSCYYCNDPYPKSQMVVDGDGRYRCPREPKGPTERELNQANLAARRTLG